ncbi:MAG: hypothetical protein USCAAHI_02315 [Beijerinckiaceae bacterium]|nr:MAG: hypothetical protein USCAAHI_02315 [Beijerinckiaceae bacterium]
MRPTGLLRLLLLLPGALAGFRRGPRLLLSTRAEGRVLWLCQAKAAGVINGPRARRWLGLALRLGLARRPVSPNRPVRQLRALVSNVIVEHL